ncbi:MAG: hypothetical protein ICV60_18725 [Pyrinomonadaceae bacterium]|nr:hypothetical protein [Pyrinomonadaceae bacterium]
MPALFTFACLLLAPVVSAQEQNASTATAQAGVAQVKAVNSTEATGATLKPKWTDYRGITIGMSADEVRAKLGNLKEKGKVQDFFVFSDKETAQVFYDEQGKVNAISVNYLGDKSSVPDAVAVLGEAVEAKEDGSMYKLVRYADAGYWVAYSRTAGDSPLTTVTIQKML